MPSVLQIYDMPFYYSVKFKNNIQIYLVYKSVQKFSKSTQGCDPLPDCYPSWLTFTPNF